MGRVEGREDWRAMRTVDTIRVWSHMYDHDWNVNGKVIMACSTCPDSEPGFNGVNVGEAWRELADKIEEEVATDYMRLPVDADGEVIHIGDVMEWSNGETLEVVAIGDGTLFYVEGDGDALAEWTRASTKRHHHAKTVEDVLREFAHVGIRIAAKNGIKAGEIDFYADEEAIADFAAKLQLKENQ